ncbi:MAG: S8 family serine peptidase [Ignavibacteria bacterium]
MFSAWGNGSSNNTLTKYYIYKNQPYPISLRSDKIFVKTRDQLTLDQFSSILGQYYQVSPVTKFDRDQKWQFVDLKMQYDDGSIDALVHALNQNSAIEYSSPVYSPTDNFNVIQGVIDEILVQFKPSVTQNQIDNYIKSNGFEIVQPLKVSGGTSYVLKVPANLSMYTIDVANMVYNTGLVNWSEPNFYFHGLLTFTPNDQYYPMQWSIKNTGTNIPGTGTGTAGCDMRVDSAWNISLGRSQCKVSMVDTGIDTTHEDLMANLTTGYDFINNHAGYYDDYNHGTCTAGIVAAVGNNTIGISGIAPNCKLIGVKIFNSAGSTNSTAITNGLMYSWQQGGWVSSNSWGGGTPVSAADQTIQDGTTTGRSGKGTVFCFASGNNNGVLTWPSTNAYVIAVGGNSPCAQRKSTTSCDGETWWGADYGTGLHVVAPCVKVYATDRMGSAGYDPSNYFSTFNGTSSATPNCAGVCALMLSLDSTQRWDTIRVRLCRTADKIGSYSYTSTGPIASLGSTWNNEMGYGKVNAYRLLTSLVPPPPPASHDIYVGPFLSFPNLFLINTAYNIRTRVQNVGTSNETGVPIRYYVNGTLTNTTNINLTTNQVDSVTNSWTPTSAGVYTLKYISALSTDTIRSNDTVQATITVYATAPPVCEGFSSTSFPPTGWSVTGTGSTYWSRQTPSGFNLGTGSARFNSWNAPTGDIGNLISPTFNTATTSTNDSLMFDYAYCPYFTSNEQLVIQASTNNGTSFNTLLTMNYTDLTTTTSCSNSEFTPSAASDWRTKKVGLPVGTNKVNIEAVSAFGNDIWVDSICVKLFVGVQPISGEIPKIYSLSQNYPNPFNPATRIEFALPKAGMVKLVVYNVLGAEVTTLINENMQAGYHAVSFNGTNLASSVYFYKLTAGDFTAVKKMLMIK